MEQGSSCFQPTSKIKRMAVCLINHSNIFQANCAYYAGIWAFTKSSDTWWFFIAHPGEGLAGGKSWWPCFCSGLHLLTVLVLEHQALAHEFVKHEGNWPATENTNV